MRAHTQYGQSAVKIAHWSPASGAKNYQQDKIHYQLSRAWQNVYNIWLCTVKSNDIKAVYVDIGLFIDAV